MDREEYHAAETAFSEGFRLVSDKLGFLRLARIPLELGVPGEPSLKLLQVVLKETFEVGRASPGFGSCELVYQPLPGTLVTSETRLSFRYVSAVTVREFTLAELLARSNADAADAALLQHHHHPRGHHEHDHGENTVKQNT
jgi:hypothetical protein